MILSGCSDGLVAVTNALTGMVVRVISDHQGAPITDLHATRRIPKVLLDSRVCALLRYIPLLDSRIWALLWSRNDISIQVNFIV